jgi:hypothetical protein
MLFLTTASGNVVGEGGDDDDYGDDLEFLLCSVCSQFS